MLHSRSSGLLIQKDLWTFLDLYLYIYLGKVLFFNVNYLQKLHVQQSITKGFFSSYFSRLVFGYIR